MQVRTLVFLAAGILAPALDAQAIDPPFCTSPILDGPGGERGYFTVDPSTPDSGHPIRITTGRHLFIPSDIWAEVHGGTVDVHVKGGPDYWTTPIGDQCMTIPIELGMPGSYTVNLYSNDVTDGNAQALYLTRTISVVGGTPPPTPISTPAASPRVLALLGGLLALLATFALRRDHRPRR